MQHIHAEFGFEIVFVPSGNSSVVQMAPLWLPVALSVAPWIIQICGGLTTVCGLSVVPVAALGSERRVVPRALRLLTSLLQTLDDRCGMYSLFAQSGRP